MPTLRKLSPVEVHTLEYTGTGQRKRVEAQYDEILRSFAPGDYAQVELEGDEKRLTVRNRLTAAATRSGITLTFCALPRPRCASTSALWRRRMWCHRQTEQRQAHNR